MKQRLPQPGRTGQPAWLLPGLVWVGIALLVVGLTGLAAARSGITTATAPWPAGATAAPKFPRPPESAPAFFSGRLAYRHVLAQVQIGPRPTGSPAGRATANYILSGLKQLGWATQTQTFIFKGVWGQNIIARQGHGPPVMIMAHYDTRPAAERDPDPARRREWITGANDGASGVAVLLELARALDTGRLKNEVWLAFVDAEDRGQLDGWPFSVGARYLAGHMPVWPQSVVVVDMVGDARQNIYFERYSGPLPARNIWAVAAALGYGNYLLPVAGPAVIDDHIPFLERNIPAANIIDFDYPYWHTTADTADKVSPHSLARVGRTLEAWLETK